MSDPSLFDQPADLPVTPYAGSSGHSGSSTSRARAVHADRSGLTGLRDRLTLAELRKRGPDGVIWSELAASQGLHHGEASAALSRLHQVGAIARLVERRNRCQIYVLPEMTAGRATANYTPNVSRTKIVELLDDIDRKLAVNNVIEARRIIATFRRAYDA